MNTELLERLMTAKEYQKKAFYALFPEEMSGHLEVIEKELKMMSAEFLKACVQNEKRRKDTSENNGSDHAAGRAQNTGRQKGMRKIDIT